jgi:hypothetical protein
MTTYHSGKNTYLYAVARMISSVTVMVTHVTLVMLRKRDCSIEEVYPTLDT